ncbi:aminotransferase class V-fold PLP-dependent enzyme [candidate division GN15 bacterium]|nr:aminotransferase class V-fold PLP-dependent enzyme [candidate division GN15 bacterium]
MSSDIPRTFAEARELFPHTAHSVYFNSASYGPFNTRLQQAIEDNIQLRLECKQDDSHDAFINMDELRGDYASLIGAEKRQVGIGLNTTFGLNIAAFGLPLKEGDEVLVSDIEFPSLVYVFRAAAETRGIVMKKVESTDRRLDIAKLEQAITPRTRMLAISWVQFFNGYKNDLKRLSDICRAHDMYFVVDGIQGMGVEPIDVVDLDIDLFSSGCQKWMLSPQGCGFFYVSDRIFEQIRPPFMSWLGVDWGMNFSDLFYWDKPYFETARKLEMGYYAILNLLGMKASVEIFKSLGIDKIQKHTHGLIDRLAAYLNDSSFYTITSSLEEKHRSSILTFTCKDHELLQKRLVKDGIVLVHREGSIRVSIHLFNNEADVDTLIAKLRENAGE